jgi:hypothetical protein
LHINSADPAFDPALISRATGATLARLTPIGRPTSI